MLHILAVNKGQGVIEVVAAIPGKPGHGGGGGTLPARRAVQVDPMSLAQGPIAQSALVEVERFEDALPPVRAFIPPAVTSE